MDILDKELEGTHSNTNNNIEIFKVTIINNLLINISILDQIENIVALF